MDGVGRGQGRGAQGSRSVASQSNMSDRQAKSTMEKVGPSSTHAQKHRGQQMVEEATTNKKIKFILCCEICEEKHFTSQCPLLHGPKSAATFCGLASDAFTFFHMPYTAATKAPRKVSATALIKIVEVMCLLIWSKRN